MATSPLSAVPEAPCTQRQARAPGTHGAAGRLASVRLHRAAGWVLRSRTCARAYARAELSFPVIVIVIVPAEWSLLSVVGGLLDGGSPALLCLGYVSLQLL